MNLDQELLKWFERRHKAMAAAATLVNINPESLADLKKAIKQAKAKLRESERARDKWEAAEREKDAAMENMRELGRGVLNQLRLFSPDDFGPRFEQPEVTLAGEEQVPGAEGIRCKAIPGGFRVEWDGPLMGRFFTIYRKATVDSQFELVGLTSGQSYEDSGGAGAVAFRVVAHSGRFRSRPAEVATGELTEQVVA